MSLLFCVTVKCRLLSFSSVSVLELDVESRRLVHRQTMRMKERAWDVTFDDLGGLWVLDGEVIVLYQLQEGVWQEIPDHPDHTRINDIIRTNWPVFQDSATEISCSNLYKMSIDNMTEYQLKKQQRIQQRLKKRGLEVLEVKRGSKRSRMDEATV
ncbi:tRNA (guanine-N(7)-)-methyltransferase non-catalytic subunit wdr4 isoform X1 [Scyliorhinus canicula]|uniref:tRNA (guanine-N(7)-)-methyltransferase non-catalytic subunit wdr4 isoform X1 n=1 Tax=Scyliorhinus canicula TaxID=7830 RepID=UPI0018F49480|nr:tRNA (guanine-N(7)-)-methyltransferase non-catalytic subunit wdr4 isoform X1 [Scyliorhinus canicula]